MEKQVLETKLKDNGIEREIIGYEKDLKTGIIFPMFKPLANPHDEPTMGALWYYDPSKDEMNTMLLFDYLDISELETVTY